jgi:hypothetical protein
MSVSPSNRWNRLVEQGGLRFRVEELVRQRNATLDGTRNAREWVGRRERGQVGDPEREHVVLNTRDRAPAVTVGGSRIGMAASVAFGRTRETEQSAEDLPRKGSTSFPRRLRRRSSRPSRPMSRHRSARRGRARRKRAGPGHRRGRRRTATWQCPLRAPRRSPRHPRCPGPRRRARSHRRGLLGSRQEKRGCGRHLLGLDRCPGDRRSREDRPRSQSRGLPVRRPKTGPLLPFDRLLAQCFFGRSIGS